MIKRIIALAALLSVQLVALAACAPSFLRYPMSVTAGHCEDNLK